MDRVFGIDLGTTNSLIGYWDGTAARLVAMPDLGTLVPSVVAFEPDGAALVGAAARASLAQDPHSAIASVKRYMGIAPDQVSEADRSRYRLADRGRTGLAFEIGDRIYTPPELSALILRELKQRAETALGETVHKVVITVPAYFNDRQRQATRAAGRLAGLDVVRLLNEPTAAALAYNLDKRASGVMAVYDLGGGTFDISILRLQRGVFEVLATAGNTLLGGDDIDERIAEHLLQHVPTELRVDPHVRSLARVAAERAKRALSETEATTVEIAAGRSRITVELTRTTVEALAEEVVSATLVSCRGALRDAGLQAGDLDEVILAGGATRMPLVRRRVEDLFRRAPHAEISPDEVVALGAAVQAGVLSGNGADILLLDVIPLSLGIETIGGVVERLIERNSTIPAMATRVFTTFVDNQTAVDLHVVQGERELASDNLSLARFKLSGIDPSPARVPRVEVTFLIDANGVLNVTACDPRSGRESTVEVNPSHGLSAADIDRILRQSLEAAASDARARSLIETCQDAQSMMRAVRQALTEVVLQPLEAQAIEEVLAALEAAVEGHDRQHIELLVDALNQLTTPLAQQLMDQTIRTALSNKSIDSVI